VIALFKESRCCAVARYYRKF